MQNTLPRSAYASKSEPAISPRSCRGRFGIPGILVFCALSVRALASDVQVLVKDQTGRPIEGAVVWVKGSRENTPPPVQTEIVLKNRQFNPLVTVIPVGSVVRFPNRDSVKHHVYSFSAAKTFDIPLFIGESPQVIKFERPGIVTLGCNIHDWMAAYIVVLDTALFAKTDASGNVLLRNLPAGPLSILGWYPRLRGPPVKADVQASQSSAGLTMKLRAALRRTPPDARRGDSR